MNSTDPSPGPPTPPGGAALIDRPRFPLWVTIAVAAVVAVALPVLLGAPGLSVIGVIIVGGLALNLRWAEPGQPIAPRAAHLVYVATLAAVAYAVFWLGLPPVLTVYFPALMLLAAAHVLGTRAALLWSLPCIALVAAGVFAPLPPPRDVSPAITVTVRLAALLTILVYAVSFRRAHDLQTTALEERATTDALTGLANRHELARALDVALRRATRFDRRGAVVFIDLDGMKSINDQHGHAVGDTVLKELAARLASITRQVDTTARLGGDEFVILLSEFDHQRGAEIFAHHLLARLREPVEVLDQSWTCSASIGVAVFPDCGVAGPELLAFADDAMYQAKRSGGGRVFVRDRRGVREIRAA